MGPDWVWKYHRYQVTNLNSEVTDEEIDLRSMSYCMSLGGITPVMELIKLKKWPIEPYEWYEPAYLLRALKCKW